MSKSSQPVEFTTFDAATHDRLVKERIIDTKLAEYDQITAVSQVAINRQMEHMHGLYEILQKLDIRQIDDPDAEGPYYIRIKSGTYKFYSFGPHHTVVEHNYPISDWTVALDVNMALNEMNRNKILENVQKRIKNLDDYSVYQLLVDFTNASMARYVDSESTIKLDKGERQWFDVFLNGYIEKLRGAPESNILHLLPRIKHKKDSEGKEGVKEGAANMLVYLQMTASRPLPSNLLPISANWVIPSADNKSEAYDGTMCLSKKIFMDEWLMPKMTKFNDQSTWVTTRAEWKAPMNTEREFHLEGHIGITQADKDNDARFKKTEWVYDSTTASETIITGIEPAIPAIPAGSRVYKYSVNSMKQDKAFPWNVYLDSTTTNYLYVPEGLVDGKSAITITGEVRIHSYIHIYGAGNIGVQQSWITATWATQLILDGVDEGHLKIRFEPATITSKVKVVKDSSFLYREFIDNQTAQVEGDMKKMDMSGVVTELAKLFSGDWTFIFAGGRDFFIDKACFNREGDLLCQVNYKAVRTSFKSRSVFKSGSPLVYN
ncbi:hypothetical protein FRB95_011716 [Tulasnella sp. JGI-2019a]|nr:hypothetical protein FRB95_011716 [Tulasnella sp. JGI-2019a]